MTRACLIDAPDDTLGIVQKIAAGTCDPVTVGWRLHFSREGTHATLRRRCRRCGDEWVEHAEATPELLEELLAPALAR